MRAARWWALAAGSKVPRSDVGVDARAARLPIGAEAVDVDLSAQPRIEILIRLSPRILRQALEVTVGFPVGGHRRIGRPCDQRDESLFGRRVALIVEPVELQ